MLPNLWETVPTRWDAKCFPASHAFLFMNTHVLFNYKRSLAAVIPQALGELLILLVVACPQGLVVSTPMNLLSRMF